MTLAARGRKMLCNRKTLHKRAAALPTFRRRPFPNTKGDQ